MLDKIKTLLYRSEGDNFDAKREQYKLSNSTKEQKSELLKDVLAMANAWIDDDAYILVGVDEKKPPPHEVVGLPSNQSIDDADIQQFFEGKLNKPLNFSYQEIEIDGKIIGVFCIPRQIRPFYCTSIFGKVNKGVVYLRRQSTTVEAMPDEVIAMHGSHSDAKEPSLSLDIICGTTKSIEKETLLVTQQVIECEDHDLIPNFGPGANPFGPQVPDFEFKNKDYYREYATYLTDSSAVIPLDFVVTNSGRAVAKNTSFRIRATAKNPNLRILSDDHLPSAPYKRNNLHRIAHLPDLGPSLPPFVQAYYSKNEGYLITSKKSNVQAGTSDDYRGFAYLICTCSCEFDMEISIRSDDIEKPIFRKQRVSITVEKQLISVDDLTNKADNAQE